MRLLLAAVPLILAVSALACGGDSFPSQDPSQGGDQQSQTGSQPGANDATSGNGGSSGSIGSVGPADVNTIRIGDQVWSRTLPMTQGQCFVQPAQSGLPDSGVAWGTLNGDDRIRFSASYNQDGTFEAEVTGDDFFWISGVRSPGEKDLVIELDFDALTIVGSGTFTNVVRNESAPGSFHFQCEPE